MKKFFTVALLLACCLCPRAQKVCVTTSEYRADVKVYITNHEYEADLKVYYTDKPYNSAIKQNKGVWYPTSKSYQADKVIYYTDKPYRADLKIFVVGHEYRAGWRKNDKAYLME